MFSIWHENVLRHLYMNIICSSNLTVDLGKVFASRTDIVQGQISEHIFASNSGLRITRSFENWEMFSSY